MTNDPCEELDGLLLEAVRELRISAETSSIPAELNADVLTQLMTMEQVPVVRSQTFPSTKRNRDRKMLLTKFGSIGVAFAFIAGLFFWDGLSDVSGHQLFAQVATRFAKVNSLGCRVQFVDDSQVEMADGEFGDKLMYLAPSQYRLDQLNGSVEIFDARSGMLLMLTPETQTAMTLTGQMANSGSGSSAAMLIEVVKSKFLSSPGMLEELEPRMIDGVNANGFRWANGDNILEAWCDPGDQLPLLIRVRFTLPSTNGTASSKINMWRVLSDFDYDTSPDPSLFSLVPPDGYSTLKMESPAVDTSLTGVDGLVALLRKCASVNDSKFPRSLSVDDSDGSPMEIMKTYAASFDQKFESGTDAEKSEMMKIITEFGTLLGSSQAFLFSQKNENDFQYFGGASLNDADRPICWYSPNGDEVYTVVYADLSITQTRRDSLPKKPDVPKAVVEPTVSTKAANPSDNPPSIPEGNVIRVNTPMFQLPPQAIRDFSKLQAIREEGRQSEIEYLGLRIPEYLESSLPPFKPGEEIVLREVQPDWKPDRDIGSQRFEFLSEFTNLKGLDLSHLYLTTRDLKAIGASRQLQRLSLSGVHLIELSTARRLQGSDLQHLKELKQLQILDLGQSNFAGGLKHLSQLPKLQTLYLPSFENLNNDSIAELKELPHLSNLIMGPVYGSNPKRTVTEAGLISLQQLPSLKNLYVGYHGKWTLPIEKLRELLPDVNVVPPR